MKRNSNCRERSFATVELAEVRRTMLNESGDLRVSSDEDKPYSVVVNSRAVESNETESNLAYVPARTRVSSTRILNGWKEVASYLGRGVRTVQRWQQLGLPVHRPQATDRSAVTALTAELDAWVAAGPTRESIERMQAELSSLRAENDALRQQLEQMSRLGA